MRKKSTPKGKTRTKKHLVPCGSEAVCPERRRLAIPWIQGNAAILWTGYAAIQKRLQEVSPYSQATKAADRAEDAGTVYFRSLVAQAQYYDSLIKPLYEAVCLHMLDWPEAAFAEYCRGMASARENPEAARAQWQRLDREATTRLLKMRQKPRRFNRTQINAKAWGILVRENGEISARALADELECSAASVVTLEAWKNVHAKRRKPKVEYLTNKHLATLKAPHEEIDLDNLPSREEEIEQLVRESAADEAADQYGNRPEQK